MSSFPAFVLPTGGVAPVKLEVADPAFFLTHPRKMRVEENAGTGRTYVLKGDRILAVAKPSERHEP